MNIGVLSIWFKRLAAILVLLVAVSFALDQILIGWHYPMGNAPENVRFFSGFIDIKYIICGFCLMYIFIFLLKRRA